jgi:hypothetical protein
VDAQPPKIADVNKQQLEALVLSAVDRIRSGRKTEDSLIECKREWPEASKARQLAGHANSARGEEIVWIIGVDENTGEITSPAMQDLATWWPQIASRFDDQVTPELFALNVQVDEHASVTALNFTTDRAPYVVKTGSGDDRVEREVPFRDGTRTRSAYRHELLRLLYPAAVPPPANVLYATLNGFSHPSSTSFHLNAAIFFEQHVDQTVMLPYHWMECQIVPLRSETSGEPIALDWAPRVPGNQEFTKIGVQQRRDGLVISGSAGIEFYGMKTLKEVSYRSYGDVQLFQLNIKLGISAAERPIVISERLRFTSLVSPTDQQPRFGSWSFPANASPAQ